MNIKQEKGSVLLIVLFVLTLLIILGAPFLSLSLTEVKQSVLHKNRIQAYYYARSGVEKAVAWLITEDKQINEEFEEFNEKVVWYGKINSYFTPDSNLEIDYEIIPAEYEELINQLTIASEFDIIIQIIREYNGDEISIRIISHGTYGSLMNEVIEKVVLDLTYERGEDIIFPEELQNFILDFEIGLFAALGAGMEEELAIELLGSAKILGTVGSNAIDFDFIQLASSTLIEGDLFLRAEYQDFGDIVEEPYIEMENGEAPWAPGNYSGGSKVWYEGLNYKARHWTNTTPGTNNVWQVIIPEGEIWPWFPFQIYDQGDMVLYNGQIYIAKWNTQGDQPDISNAWELPIPNITGDILYLEEEKVFPDPVFPDFPEDEELLYQGSITTSSPGYYLINEDGRFDSIKITGNRTLTIDLDEGDRVIKVKDLDIVQGHIDLINTGDNGRLIIYLEEDLSIGGSSTINELGDLENVIIYYAGTDTPDIGGNTNVKGSLFLESADFEISGSNGVSGHIISGGDNISITGSADLYTRIIYAPNSHVNIGGSGTVTGVVISKRLTASGGNRYAITYQEPDFMNFPSGIFFNDLDSSQKVDIDKWR